MAEVEQAYNNIDLWLDTNKDKFAPPVCNKLMHGPHGQLFVMYVGGPNQRKDFHLEEGEELFYMVKGNMCLKVLEKGQFRDIEIREGEIFLLPGRIPHSPQRFEGTIGLVLERQRLSTEKDCIRYFVQDGSTNTLFERWMQCTNLGTQIAEVIREYFASEEHATGRPKAAPNPIDPTPFNPDINRQLQSPFSLSDWLRDNHSRIISNPTVRLFDESYQTDVLIHGSPQSVVIGANEMAETWLWQVKGSASLSYDGGDNEAMKSKEWHLDENSSFLVKKGEKVVVRPHSEGGDGFGVTLSVTMDPRGKKRIVPFA